MTSELDSTDRSGPRSAGDRARAWAFARDFWPGIIGYMVAVAGVVGFGHLDGTSPWRFLWSMVPVLPVAPDLHLGGWLVFSAGMDGWVVASGFFSLRQGGTSASQAAGRAAPGRLG
ncbi:MAG: hypothetical protein ACYDH5_12830 [Acidimicrobiales bacterium]